MSATQTTGDVFGQQTLWSTIVRVQQGDEAIRRAALERLTNRYYQPILCCVKSHWRPNWPEAAEDVAHDFLYKRLLTDAFFRDLGPEKGRFRAFIKRSIRNYISEKIKEWNAGKRGGGQAPVSLDETGPDGNPIYDPASDAPRLAKGWTAPGPSRCSPTPWPPSSASARTPGGANCFASCRATWSANPTLPLPPSLASASA